MVTRLLNAKHSTADNNNQGLHYGFVDQDAEESNMHVNAVAIVICYIKDVFAMIILWKRTKRLCCFKVG